MYFYLFCDGLYDFGFCVVVGIVVDKKLGCLLSEDRVVVDWYGCWRVD